MTHDVAAVGDRAVGPCDGSVGRDAVWAALEQVDDPELPLSIVDLGLVRSLEITDGVVTIGLTYTSLACPCTDMLREDVESAVGTVAGVCRVVVVELLERWSRTDITPHGRELLRAVAVV